MDIAVTGFAGYEGSKIIYANKDYKDKLLERYPESFFGVFKDNAEERTGEKQDFENFFLKMRDEGLSTDSGDGGVLAALWKVLKQNRLGGTYSLKDIPVLQQTIEVCEMFGLNPYRLHSPGCRVWLTNDTAVLRHEAAGAGVPLSVIGFTTKGAAVMRTDTEVSSSLRRPETDEIIKVSSLL